MGKIIPSFKINLHIAWYEALLAAVSLGLIAFGTWALLDSLSIGSSKAGWRFMLLFVTWSLPGIAVLVFLRPRSEGDIASTPPKD
jgi:hypothetical protein